MIIQTQCDVSALVDSINSKYGEGPSGSGREVVYFEERVDADITLPKRLAFFAVSHVLMITAPRSADSSLSLVHSILILYPNR